MFNLNKLYNSDTKELSDIGYFVMDRNGLEEGLSGDNVDDLLDLIINLQDSMEEIIRAERETAYNEAMSEVEDKELVTEEELKALKEEHYDKGYDDGYEKGSSFKEKMKAV